MSLPRTPMLLLGWLLVAPAIAAVAPVARSIHLEAPKNQEMSVVPSTRLQHPAIYPRVEACAGIEGTTVLLVSIDGNGYVRDITVEKSSRNRNIDRAAILAAGTWQYVPRMENGKPVLARGRIPVDFILPKQLDPAVCAPSAPVLSTGLAS